VVVVAFTVASAAKALAAIAATARVAEWRRRVDMDSIP
jgi:hypothetical protein